MKLCYPNRVTLLCGEGRPADITESLSFEDCRVCLGLKNGVLSVEVTSEVTPLSGLVLDWKLKPRPGVRVLGDTWERGYGDLAWKAPDASRVLPWYCLVSDGSDSEPDCSGRLTEGFGVKVRPGSMASWRYGEEGLSLYLDLRSGGVGSTPNGRRIKAAEVVFEEYPAVSALKAARAFCKRMCEDPLPVGRPVFGSNNWYYAYGESSFEQILRDAELVADLCEGLPYPPYMVIDAGWSPNLLNAPWVPNERFRDMKKLAEEMSARGTVPGIWVAYLGDETHDLPLPEEARLRRDPRYLDPSHPDTINFVCSLNKQISDWGYRLIKHDFSTNYICGCWGFEASESLFDGGWSFFDRTRTTAEILIDFYRAILESADGALIVGCNTVSHLCAGLVHQNRIGDDTSGREWERTVKMGWNTIAFRLPQHGAFYQADADCVGIMGEIPWEQNRMWLERLAASGTPLFVSADPDILTDGQKDELRAAYRRCALGNESSVPTDWMEQERPADWKSE